MRRSPSPLSLELCFAGMVVLAGLTHGALGCGGERPRSGPAESVSTGAVDPSTRAAAGGASSTTTSGAGATSSASAAGSVPRPVAPADVPVLPVDPAFFERNEPPVSKLLAWGARLAVRTRAAAWRDLDLEAARSFALGIPGCETIEELAVWRRARVALCRNGNTRALAVENGNGFGMRELPPELAAGTAPIQYFAADDADLVLGDERVLHRLDRGGIAGGPSAASLWHRVALGALPSAAPKGGANHALVHAGKLYLGYDRGEWGGALLVVDLASGSVTLAPKGKHELDLPIRALRVGPDDKVWLVRGLSHLGLREGELAVLDGDTLRTYAATSALSGDKIWNFVLAPTSFDGLAFDAAGTPHLLTSVHGVVRIDSERTQVLTPAWPRQFVYVQALELAGERAVIATYDAGILVWDLRSGAVRHIALH